MALLVVDGYADLTRMARPGLGPHSRRAALAHERGVSAEIRQTG